LLLASPNSEGPAICPTAELIAPVANSRGGRAETFVEASAEIKLSRLAGAWAVASISCAGGKAGSSNPVFAGFPAAGGPPALATSLCENPPRGSSTGKPAHAFSRIPKSGGSASGITDVNGWKTAVPLRERVAATLFFPGNVSAVPLAPGFRRASPAFRSPVALFWSAESNELAKPVRPAAGASSGPAAASAESNTVGVGSSTVAMALFRFPPQPKSMPSAKWPGCRRHRRQFPATA